MSGPILLAAVAALLAAASSDRSRSTLKRARAWSSAAIAFSVRIRSMTVDSLAVMSETNAATAPRRNVGTIAFEKISDSQ